MALAITSSKMVALCVGTLNPIDKENALATNGKKIEDKNLRNKLASFFRDNAHNFGIDLAFLYGSWATGSPRDDSDIDIAVWFSSPIPSKDDTFSEATKISTKLSLLLHKEVNVLILSPDFRDPMLQYNAIALGIPIFIGSFDLYVKVKMEAIAQMEDFGIFGRKWQIEAAEKRLKERIRA